MFVLPSMQVIAPVVQDVVPFLHLFGLVVHALPTVQATQVPVPLQTRSVPQLVPGALLLPSMHVWAPVAQDVVPFLQMFELVVHAAPAVHATHVPEPLHTRFMPQVVPAAVLPPSMHVIAPVAHEVVPTLQLVGLLVHD